ncbi:MAG TPA: T9SS type A sorting domain-containing protein, partial [Candidatus Marinimicrobia bacterium]|nr:T9SS type A sorting domain-containing protein [Candidatus Neomarinimicrobiota bacterium]
QSDVFLHIYDIRGRLVETLVAGELLSGDHAVQWDASDYASGVYFVRLTAGESRQTRKMLLVK